MQVGDVPSVAFPCLVAAPYVAEEVELEPVHVPVSHGGLPLADQEFADFRETRVEDDASAAWLQRELPEAFNVRALLSDHRHSVPQHELHPKAVHPLDVRLHVRELVRANVPVSAERIASAVVVRLPAVVDDDRLHAKRRGYGKFLFEGFGGYVLVERVPRGIQCGAGGLRGLSRRRA